MIRKDVAIYASERTVFVMATFSARLKEALEMKNMSAAELARLSGVSEPDISRYKKGEFIPKLERMTRMADALGVAPDWLAGKSVAMAPDTKFRMEVSPDEHDLLIALRDLNPTQRQMIVDFIEFLEGRSRRSVTK